MQLRFVLPLALLAGLFLGHPVSAETSEQVPNVTIRQLPENGTVQVKGIVSEVNDDGQIMVRDQTGQIKIDLRKATPETPPKGAAVAVTGKVNTGLLGKDLDAQKLVIEPGPEAAPQ